MRSIFLLLFLAASAFSQPVVSNVRIGDQTHSTIQLAWDSSVTPDLQRALIGPANVSISVAGGTARATFPVAHRIRSGTATVYVFNSATGALNTGNAGATATYSSPTVLTWATFAAGGVYTNANVYTWVENGIDGVGAYPFALNQNIALSGFNPGVTWDICVQSHDASGWSGCTAGVNQRVAFAAAPDPDPAPPALPTLFSYDYPNMTGATSATMASDCSDWTTQWNDAFARRASGNTFLYIPSDAVCTGVYLIPRDPDAGQLDMSLTNWTTNTLATKAAAAHGLSPGDGVRFGIDVGNGYALPTSILTGQTYYVKTAPSASTFTLSATPGGATLRLLSYAFTADPSTNFVRVDGSQNASVFFNGFFTVGNGGPVRVVSTGALPAPLTARATYYGVQCENPGASLTGRCKLSTSPGGSPITLTSTGSGTHYIGYVGANYPYFLQHPQVNSNWIVVRTDTPDAQLPPDHVQVDGPGYSPLMPKFIAGNSSIGYIRPITFGALNHHLYIEGLELTQAATAATDPNPVDPPAPPGFFHMNPSNDQIIWSRNYIHGLGCPDRIWSYNLIEGTNVAFDSNYFSYIEPCHPAYAGMLLTFTNSTITIGGGSAGTPTNPLIPFSGATFTMTSAVDGHAYFSISNSGALRVTVPNGVTGSCAPSPCTVTATGGGYPLISGRISEVPIGQALIAGGVVTAVANVRDGTPQNWMAEDSGAASPFLTTLGPGPIAFTNNYLYNVTGITWHLSDDGGGRQIPSDIDITRNQFVISPDHIYGQAGSNGRHYITRNQLECKTCQRIRIRGNIFDGQFQDVTASGCALQVPSANAVNTIPPAQNIASDILIQYNTIRNAECALYGTGGAQGGRQPKVARRVEYSNNLIYNMQGWTQATTLSVKWPNPQGYAFTWGIGGEDIVLKHNTFYDSRGSYGSWALMQSRKLHGFSATDNIFFFGDDNTVFSPAAHGIINAGLGNDQPQCWLLTGEAMMNCMFTPNYTFGGNVLIVGYNDTKNQANDALAATIASQYPSTPLALIPQGGTVAARIAGSRFHRAPIPANGFRATTMSHNLRLRPDSPYAAGAVPHLSTDGLGAGPDIDDVEDTQGIIKNVRTLNITSSGATIAFHAPDAGTACYVGYGTGPIGILTATAFDPITWSASAADTSPGKERSIELPGLLDGTSYFYQVWCEGAAPTETKNLRTL